MNIIRIIFKNRIVCYAFALLGLAVLLSGCATMPMEGKVAHETLPKSHLWAALYGADEEPAGYAMYTYVLINRSKADLVAWNRYERLVESITSSTSSVDTRPPDFNRSLFNLFLIPQEAESLNDKLAKSILTSIAASVQKQELRELININPGPFLISAAEPISNENLNKKIDMLYVDLTQTNVDAMPEVVAAYKKRLTSDSIEGLERFNSIRLSLLNFILDADDYIGIIKVAYAGWIKD